jgi:hypothetical protein
MDSSAAIVRRIAASDAEIAAHFQWPAAWQPSSDAKMSCGDPAQLHFAA